MPSPQPAKSTSATENRTIIIAGAGPAGLFMGLCLAEKGFEVQIFEKRTELISDSRSLGIHPPSLRMLEKLGLLNEFLNKGIQVPIGWAHDGQQMLGCINFSGIDQKPSYILIHPQNETEKILKQAFIERMPNGIQYGTSIESFTDLESEIALEVRNHQHELRTYHTPILISCDGKNSTLREAAAISYEGHNYPDTYLMGDFPVVASDPKEPVVYSRRTG
jgi:2-polyprenyl-6-methoxyphenol hydroxylase-like FAD-dependent oxidoreductase